MTVVSTSTQAVVRQKYRLLGRMIRKLPEENPYSSRRGSNHQLTADKGWEQLREGFRKPVSPGETLERRLKNADDKIAFLRMITPKESTVTATSSISSPSTTQDETEAVTSGTSSSSSSSGQAFGFAGSGGNSANGTRGGRWIYRNGERLEVSEGTVRDSKGRVVSNWDGKNLDPEQVKRHNHHLKRLGFRNNAHAKGIF